MLGLRNWQEDIGLHYIKLQRPGIPAWELAELVIDYTLNESTVTFKNHFDFDVPTVDDFEIDDARRLQHGDSETWEYREDHKIEMIAHVNNNITHLADNLPYKRDPKEWVKLAEIIADNGSYASPTWPATSVVSNTTYRADFYRLVDNEFAVWDMTPGFMVQNDQQISGVNIEVDEYRDGIFEISSETPNILQKKNNYPDHRFDVRVPLTIGNGADTRYLTTWDPDDFDMRSNSTFDAGSNTATTTITPDLHHMNTYGNAYKAHYAKFTAFVVDEYRDLTDDINQYTTGIQVGTFDENEGGWPVTVPAEYVDGNITYKFIAWWDGEMGTQVGNNYTRTLKILNQSLDHYRFNTVAIYKVERQSIGGTVPTRTNSQRKVALQFQGQLGQGEMHHVVYESGGEVYFTYTTDGGNTWSREHLISNASGSSSKPCVAAAYHGTDPQDPYTTVEDNKEVVYITYVEGNDVVLKYRKRQDLDATWHSPDASWKEIARYPVSDPSNCTPVVAATMPSDDWDPGHESSCMLTWEDGYDMKYSIFVNYLPFEYNDGAQIVTCDDLILDTGSYWAGSQNEPRYPSLNATPWRRDHTGAHLPSVFWVSWNEGGQLYAKELSFSFEDNPDMNELMVYPKQLVPTASNNKIKPSAAPSLSHHHVIPAIAYEARATNSGSSYPYPTQVTTVPFSFASRLYYPITARYPVMNTGAPIGGQKRAFVRQRDNTSWSPWSTMWRWVVVTTTATANELAPCLTSVGTFYNGFTDEMRVTMNESGNTHSITVLDGSNPTTVTTTRNHDGIDPNVNTTGTINMEVLTHGGTSPYQYSVGANTSDLNKTTSINNPVMKQLVVFDDDSSSASYGICVPQVGDGSGATTDIAWAAYDDSLLYEVGLPANELIKTSPFIVPENGYFEYATDMFAAHADKFDAVFAFEVNFYDSETDSLLLTDRIPVTSLPTDSAMYLVYRTDISELEDASVYMSLGLDDTVSSMHHEVLFLALIDEPVIGKMSYNNYLVPDNVTLSQNYPNPFNPSTEITYGIPQDGDVKLTVFDNLGRQVGVLVDGYKSAGTYTVQFNAEDLPSGMYLYRIETAGGTLSKKMVLMK